LIVRQATSDDYPVWAAMLARLHADQSAEEFDRELADSLHEPFVGFLAFNEDGEPAGMIDATIRSYAGAPPTSAPLMSRICGSSRDIGAGGVARELLAAVEQWARDQGLDLLGSDALLDNGVSHAWHSAAGFDEIERIVVFGKPLDRG
jgi:aminoglycoside 6'-N-acetyltransferase I